ncbi:MAG TPA: sigma 54-interacting transcriptional regulator [Thermoanaerobaculia bacterium]|nr:sigma 54-interacting transcriptional regulator [Thermoanaerobaculia bacterium]
MSDAGAQGRTLPLAHRAFEPRPAVSLAHASLTDRARLALLLQGAALLSHLDRVGWCLPGGWAEAAVAADGTLCLPSPAPGRSPWFAQQQLRNLVAELFGSEEIAGRGEARRALRHLVGLWRSSLVPVPADRAVADLLEQAEFLWEPAFAASRLALVAELHLQGARRPWVAGPGAARRRLLGAAADRAGLERLLAGDGARELWRAAPAIDPRRLAARGHPGQAVALWRGRKGAGPEERLALAEALFADGRFEQAAALAGRLEGEEARLLRSACLARLGRWAASLAEVKKAVSGKVPPEHLLAGAEIAVRCLANLGQQGDVGEWVDRARRAARGPLAADAALLAAFAAWDLGQLEEMPAHLAAAEAVCADLARAWRWCYGASVAARHEGRIEDARHHLTRALGGSRRHLRRFEAGELWNELGIVRAVAGDLAGAERAFLHTVRLLTPCEGPRRTTLALANLAEVRLRRGRFEGVREIVEQVTVENRLAANARGAIQDAELAARLELALGRPQAALTLCRQALAEAERRKLSWRRDVLYVLAARAQGWLGEREQAALCLAEAGPGAEAELEPEERPALFALGGDRAGALALAAGPSAPLWQAVLEGREPALDAWAALAALEPYRASRLVFDLVLLDPEGVAPDRVGTAVAALRRSGARFLADRLEEATGGPVAPSRGAPEAPPVQASPARLVGSAAPRRSGIIGESPLLAAAIDRLERLAAGAMPLLILGESGTGKELAARLAHRASPRASLPFLPINCAAVSENLLLSDLFGHARGAFTGADRDRAGLFEAAQGGTVFLDEIGDLPLAAQGMLLRVLQESEIRRLGESVPRKVKVRVIAATHRDLAAMVTSGGFRQDLYYRLRVAAVRLPSLAERREDIPVLAAHFLDKVGAAGVELSAAASKALFSHAWPGNIRELENVITVAAALAAGDGASIEPHHLDLPEAAAPSTAPDFHREVDALRRKLVIAALAESGGNRAEAARRLGLTRQAMNYLVKGFRLA